MNGTSVNTHTGVNTACCVKSTSVGKSIKTTTEHDVVDNRCCLSANKADDANGILTGKAELNMFVF